MSRFRLGAVPALVLAAVLVAGGCGSSSPEAQAGTSRSSSTPIQVAVPPFSATSFWNQALAEDVAIDPESDRLVAELVDQVDRFGPWINSERWSIPVYEVAPDTPRVPVRHDSPYNPALKRILAAGVPIPPGAEPAAGDDGHLVIWDRARDEMWEFWTMRRENSTWVAGHAGYLPNVSESDGIFPSGPNWGATATGLAAAGGLIRIDEWHSGEINHALAMALPETAAGRWVWPAQRSDGSSDDSLIPQGTRFRLDPSLDLAALDLPAAVMPIARAAQQHGLVVRDFGGAVALYVEAPTNDGQRDQLDAITEERSPAELLENFPWESLQTLERGPIMTWPAAAESMVTSSTSGTISR